jgi:hypothetical protein
MDVINVTDSDVKAADAPASVVNQPNSAAVKEKGKKRFFN